MAAQPIESPKRTRYAPRKLHQANEILHVRGDVADGITREPPCVIGRLGERRCSGRGCVP